ncbi:Short-chain dehydrogenase/reductase family 9C member 7 [Cryptotermes secundus]|uniref:Short-chain dehydrogenase/reductase family 9C member 7 n=1 Tax=Cryptotermes secundus TaxID=105785 RepID=A0A2J7R4Z8_9NEOP|nr:short-chain dehydrogenase/reductase family 9C member 7 isoform X1 [Cryptotermes secundus]PNF35912.1 Short-chain dehydrogenase/reductase family 9C member 7 [Cryptotermes secundus]
MAFADELLLLVSALLLAILLFAWLKKNSQLLPDIKNKAVLITGCDSGFGNELAKRLDKLGVTVFAGCLFPEGPGAVELKSISSGQLHILHLDVTKEDHVKRAVETVTNSLGVKTLWAVVNNAGIATVGNMEWMSVETVKRVFDVNTFGPVAVTNAFLPLLRKSRGRVVIISSLAGLHIIASVGVYCMSKHATTALANVLRYELSQWGISVHDIQPGLFRTKISERGTVEKYVDSNWDKLPKEISSVYGQKYCNYYKANILNIFMLPVLGSSKIYQVVDDLLHAIFGKSPKAVYRPGLRSKLLHVLLSLTPPPLKTYINHKLLPELQTKD